MNGLDSTTCTLGMRRCRSDQDCSRRPPEGSRQWRSGLAQSSRTPKTTWSRRTTWGSSSSTRWCRWSSRPEPWATTPRRWPGGRKGWPGLTSEEDLPGRRSCSRSAGRWSLRWDYKLEDWPCQAEENLKTEVFSISSILVQMSRCDQLCLEIGVT